MLLYHKQKASCEYRQQTDGTLITRVLKLSNRVDSDFVTQPPSLKRELQYQLKVIRHTQLKDLLLEMATWLISRQGPLPERSNDGKPYGHGEPASASYSLPEHSSMPEKQNTELKEKVQQSKAASANNGSRGSTETVEVQRQPEDELKAMQKHDPIDPRPPGSAPIRTPQQEMQQQLQEEADDGAEDRKRQREQRKPDPEEEYRKNASPAQRRIYPTLAEWQKRCPETPCISMRGRKR